MSHLQGRSARRLVSSLLALAAIAICVPASASAQTAFRTGPGIAGVDETCEVVHLSSDGNLATCTDASDDAGLALLDVSNLEDPVLVGQADFEAEDLEMTSATFSADDRFIIGCFVEATIIFLVVAPIILPTLKAVGISEVHFGLITVVAMGIGLFTPPVGLALYMLRDMCEISFEEAMKAVAPFLIALVASLALITYVPEIVLFVPRLLGLIQ